MQEVPTRPANQAPAGLGESDAGPWLVSYADDDDREMTAADIFRALGSGEIDMESIAWRDGMAEWQAIGEIAALRAEIERLAGTRGDRKRTVMGGFQAQQNAGRAAPVPHASQLSGTRPTATGAVAASPAAQLQARSTLLGTGAQPQFGLTGSAPLAGNARGLSPAVPNPRVADLESAAAHGGGQLRTANVPKAALKSSPLARRPAPQPLPEPSDDGPESWDQEPTVSLHQDSIVSLPPEALESVVAFLPPMDAPSSPRGIFEVDSNPPPQFVIQNAPAGRQQAQQQHLPRRARVISERASESILDEPMALPLVNPVANSALRPHVHAPHPPRPAGARGPDSPLPQAPLGGAAATPFSPQLNPALTDDTFVSSRPKGGGFGKVLLGLLLFGAIGAGMFYMGRQTAVAPTAQNTPPKATEVPTQPLATPAANAEAKGTAGADADKAAAAAENKAGADKGAEDKAGASEPSGVAPKGRNSGVGSVSRGTERPSTGSAKSPQTPEPSPKEEPSPAPAPASDAAFDTSAASAALTKAAGNASSCRQGTDPSGVANVTVTFANSGRAINANVSGPPFAGTVTGGCIASKMRQATVPAFGGDRITVRKQVVIQ